MIVLDIMLPGVDGIEVCRRTRTFSDAYIVMLTARTGETDKSRVCRSALTTTSPRRFPPAS